MPAEPDRFILSNPRELRGIVEQKLRDAGRHEANPIGIGLDDFVQTSPIVLLILSDAPRGVA